MKTRPTFDQTFLRMAEVLSRRATCPKKQVGAIIVDLDNRIVAAGYNGPPAGLPHCTAVGCKEEEGHCTRSLHAESNALYNGDIRRMKGGTMFLWGAFPCYRCSQGLITVGLETLVVALAEPDEVYNDGLVAYELLKEAGIRSILLATADIP